MIAQDQREENLESFRDGVYTVLVATDVASRGLDIPDVKVRQQKKKKQEHMQPSCWAIGGRYVYTLYIYMKYKKVT